MPGGESRFQEQLNAGLDHTVTWDFYALSYDRILPLMPYYQEVIHRHVDALTTTFPGPVADLGAGTGNLVERLITLGRNVTAVDNSRAMLAKLRSKPVLACRDWQEAHRDRGER